MPYLTKESRAEIQSGSQLNTAAVRTPGDLNFALTQTVLAFIAQAPAVSGKYAIYNAAIGALECCKLELYRRVISEYENLKIKENGDVY